MNNRIIITVLAITLIAFNLPMGICQIRVKQPVTTI